MAKNEGRKDYLAALAPFGITGGFQQLIDQAVRNQWTAQEFEHHLVLSKPFQQMFPGLVTKEGIVNPFLTGGSGSLSTAVARYRSLTAQYEKVASNFPGVKVGRDLIGVLISHQVSADEFAARANVETTLKKNPELRDAFNAELGAAGQQKLDEMGIRKFLAGQADAKLYDIYEAAQLRSAGLDFTPQEALNVASQVGVPGQQFNTGQLISQVKAQLGDIGPELDKAHISLSGLAISLAQQGLDAQGIGNHIRQLIDQRRAQGSYVAGVQPRQGTAGGLALYEDTGATSSA